MKRIAFALYILIAFNSCVYFLYPVTENDADLVFEKQLIGQWQQHDSEKYIVDTSTSSGSISYNILYTTHNTEKLADTTFIVGKMFRIDNDLYLDCILDDRVKKQVPEPAAYMLLPVHIFYKIRFVDNNTIILSSLVADKIQQLAQQKQVGFKAEVLADSSDLLILDKSGELKIKLKQLQQFPEAFENDTLRRVMH
jgi:hypothetical protein